MNKTISVERIFALAQYENLKVTDTITDIPDEVALNQNAMQLLRNLQLIDMEGTYLHYVHLRSEEPKLSVEGIDTAVSFIEEGRAVTFEKLLEALKKGE